LGVPWHPAQQMKNDHWEITEKKLASATYTLSTSSLILIPLELPLSFTALLFGWKSAWLSGSLGMVVENLSLTWLKDAGTYKQTKQSMTWAIHTHFMYMLWLCNLFAQLILHITQESQVYHIVKLPTCAKINSLTKFMKSSYKNSTHKV